MCACRPCCVCPVPSVRVEITKLGYQLEEPGKLEQSEIHRRQIKSKGAPRRRAKVEEERTGTLPPSSPFPCLSLHYGQKQFPSKYIASLQALHQSSFSKFDPLVSDSGVVIFATPKMLRCRFSASIGGKDIQLNYIIIA